MYVCTVSLEEIIMQFQLLKQYHGIRNAPIIQIVRNDTIQYMLVNH